MKNVPQHHQAQSLPIGDKINKPIDFEIVKCASGGNFSNCLLLHAHCCSVCLVLGGYMVGVLVFAVMREIVMIMVMLGGKKLVCRWDFFLRGYGIRESFFKTIRFLPPIQVKYR